MHRNGEVKYIDILGLTFEVRFVQLPSGVHGETDVDTRVIKVDAAKPHLHDTIFHETVHAALGVASMDLKERREEALCRVMEHAFARYVTLDLRDKP